MYVCSLYSYTHRPFVWSRPNFAQLVFRILRRSIGAKISYPKGGMEEKIKILGSSGSNIAVSLTLWNYRCENQPPGMGVLDKLLKLIFLWP